MRAQQVKIDPFEGMDLDDLDSDVDHVFMDDMDMDGVYEEGIDEEL